MKTQIKEFAEKLPQGDFDFEGNKYHIKSIGSKYITLVDLYDCKILKKEISDFFQMIKNRI